MFRMAVALLTVTFLCCPLTLQGQEKLPGTGDIPTFLVSPTTKQFYRFHFSGLQSSDAIRLAQQLWPFVAKLPSDNPLRRAIVQARDAASFADNYRSLRSIFLSHGIDTAYFQAEEHWIDSTVLPGYIIIPGTPAVFGSLEKRLASAGHSEWAKFLSGFRPAAGGKPWMISTQGNVSSSTFGPRKAAVIEQAMKVSCPLRQASVNLGKLPALQVNLADALPLTVTNLERNRLDMVLGAVLPALFPSVAKTAELSNKAVATTFSVSMYPFFFVRQTSHMTNRQDATALAEEVQKTVNGVVRQAVNMDDDFGPLIGMLAKSMIHIDVRDRDVNLISKPAVLFDVEMARRTAKEMQEQDWTALSPPAGYHWELVGIPGTSQRYDVLTRVTALGHSGSKIAPEKTTDTGASFVIPSKGGSATITCDKRGALTVVSSKNEKPEDLPILECLDENSRVVATLRLDLSAGDPRYDLSRTRSVLQKRIAERTVAERQASKELDDLENAHQKTKLEQKGRPNLEEGRNWDERLFEKGKPLGQHRAAIALYQEWEKKAAELQARFPAATLVRDGSEAVGSGGTENRKNFRFAGQWLFDYGVLSLYQDNSGVVTGVYACKAYQTSGKYLVDGSKGTTNTAIVSGQVKGNTLAFTLMDLRNRDRTGKITLDADGLTGTWNLAETTRPDMSTPGKGKGLGGRPLGDLARRSNREYEGPAQGRIERIDLGKNDLAWVQEGGTGHFDGYWVHPTSKTLNTLLKQIRPGLFEASGAGNSGLSARNNGMKAAAAGKVMYMLQSAGDRLSAKIIMLQLSDDEQALRFESDHAPGVPRGMTLNGGLGTSRQKGIELTREKK